MSNLGSRCSPIESAACGSAPEHLVVRPTNFVRPTAAAKEALSSRAQLDAAKPCRWKPPRGPGSREHLNSDNNF